MTALIRRGVRALVEGGSATSTQQPTGTVASDLSRQSERVLGKEAFWSLSAGVVRYRATARVRVQRPARRAERKLTAAEKRIAKRSSSLTRTRASLSTPRIKAWMGQVTEYDRSSALIGHLFTWVLPISIALYVCMGISDPGYVLDATRRGLNVGNSVSTWDLGHDANRVALAVAGGVTIALVVAINAAARALAAFLFWPHLVKQAEEFPEVYKSSRRVARWQRLLLAVLAVAGVAFLTHVIHGMASAQFLNTFSTALSKTNGTAESNEVLVLMLTNLPWLLLAIEVIGHVPALEHARRTSRWAVRLRIRQALSIRLDHRHRRLCDEKTRRATIAVLWVADLIEDTGDRFKAEVIEAGITTGVLASDVVIAPQPRTTASPKAGAVESPEAERLVPVNLTGKPAPQLADGFPVVSNRVASLFNRYHLHLARNSDLVGLERDWHDLRHNPDGYCGIEGRSPATCLSATAETHPGTAAEADGFRAPSVGDLASKRTSDPAQHEQAPQADERTDASRPPAA